MTAETRAFPKAAIPAGGTPPTAQPTPNPYLRKEAEQAFTVSLDRREAEHQRRLMASWNQYED